MRKTKKAVSQRFRITKSGKVKFTRPGKGHLLTSKNRKRKRKLRKQGYIAGKSAANIRRLLPHG